VRNRFELIKATAEKVPDASGQYQINQSRHSQVSADLGPTRAFAQGFGAQAIGANRKRTIFFVNMALIFMAGEVENLANFQPQRVCYG